MFARAALIKVEPGCKVELDRTLQEEIIPLLREETNFRGLLALTMPSGTKALSLILWDEKKRVDGVFARGVRALAALARIALGVPRIQVYEVSNHTLPAAGQITGQRDEVIAPPDLRFYQMALRPFIVSPVRNARGWGFPLVRGLINSFHK